jgi:hypothetical protein
MIIRPLRLFMLYQPHRPKPIPHTPQIRQNPYFG